MMRRIAAATLSALLLVAVLAGLPALLLAVGGNPLPDQVPDLDQVRRALTAPDDGRLVLAAAVLAGWVCWAMLVGATALEVIDQIRSLHRTERATTAHPRQGGAGSLGVPRSLMRPLVASVLAVLVSAPTPAGLSTGPAAAQPTATGPAVPGTTDPAVSDRGPASSDESLEQEPRTEGVLAAATHTVQPGDTLWDISEDHLGAGECYPEVYAENNDQLISPHLIYPGTVLVLPGVADTVTAPEVTEVVVAPGDTLSGLAAEHLGDPDRWPEIYDASTDTLQDSGARLVDPDLIHPGWRLHIPVESPASHDSHQPQPMSPEQPSGAAATATSHTRTPPTATDAGTAAGQHVGVADTTPSPTARGGRNGDLTPAGGVTTDERPDTTQEEVDPALLPDAAWLVAGLAGAGGTLAGALWLGLTMRRRAQARHRRPGKDVGAPLPPELDPLEQTTQTVGAVAAVSIETLDRVLKHLVTSTPNQAGSAVPPLVAARMSNRDGLDLSFSQPQEQMPTAWEPVADDRTRWRLAQPVVGPEPEIDAPYPLLATIGTDDTEGTWLLNLEGQHVAIGGDPTMAHDLTRHITAGTLLNPWSQTVRVDCLGIAHELHPVDPARVSLHDPEDDLQDVRHHLELTAERAQHYRVDAATGRVHGTGDDAWPARLVIAGTDTEHTQRIADMISASPSGVSAAIVMTQPGNDPAGSPSLLLELTPGGRVWVGDIGLDLVAVGLTADEATGIGMLCAAAEDHRDTPVPSHDVDDPEDLRHYIDRSGGLLQEHRSTQGPEPLRAPRTPVHHGDSTLVTIHDAADRDAASVLQAPVQDYLAVAATTEADLNQIAPAVTQQTRDNIADADPTLDEDLEAWNDPDSRRARLRLLGPVKAQTFGVPQSHTKAFLTEILAYLALHPDGVSSDQLAEAVGTSRKKARDYVSTIRAWLGKDPATGQLHLPHADDVRRHDGAKVYRLSGVLVDADLFTRLHARGISRGPDGLQDLIAALRLVTGQPFDQLRPQGWGWLFTGTERHDHYLVVGIGTVAHLVTVHSLETMNLEQARWAAQVAGKADPYAETPNLDLAAIAIAEGRPRDSANLLRAHVSDRTDDDGPPPDLSARTEEILDRHPHWLTGNDAAAS